MEIIKICIVIYFSIITFNNYLSQHKNTGEVIFNYRGILVRKKKKIKIKIFTCKFAGKRGLVGSIRTHRDYPHRLLRSMVWLPRNDLINQISKITFQQSGNYIIHLLKILIIKLKKKKLKY